MNLILCALVMFTTALPATAGDVWTLPDPTRPAGKGTARAPGHNGLVLQSTMVSPQHKTAVISGQVVRIGAKVGNATVKDIRTHEVVISRGGQDTALRLLPKVDKQK